MSLANAIKSAYPSAIVAPDGNVIIVSDQDGERIEVWGLPEPRPAESALLASYDPLPAAKAHKLAAIRAEAKQLIEGKWPDWLQRNIALGLDPDLAQPCADDIAAVRTASNAAEDAINAATTVAEVEAVSASWPVL